MDEGYLLAISKILVPILYLAMLAFVIAFASIQLQSAWQKRSKIAQWFYTWLILMALFYFYWMPNLLPQ